MQFGILGIQCGTSGIHLGILGTQLGTLGIQCGTSGIHLGIIFVPLFNIHLHIICINLRTSLYACLIYRNFFNLNILTQIEIN